MVQFFSRGNFETADSTSLWIQAGHNMLDCAVLTAGIHSLKDDEKSPAVLRIKTFLHYIQPLDVFGDFLFRLFLVRHQFSFSRIIVRKLDAGLGPHAESRLINSHFWYPRRSS